MERCYKMLTMICWNFGEWSVIFCIISYSKTSGVKKNDFICLYFHGSGIWKWFDWAALDWICCAIVITC